METIVISDLHIGCPFFHCEEFLRFVSDLPQGVDLVLNGDTADYWADWSLPHHKEALDTLGKESEKRRVVWVRGNHDKKFQPETPGRIEFVDSHSIGKRLFIAHGHEFENRAFYHRWFVTVFRFFYDIYMKMGGKPAHVAVYAKHFPRLYRTFCDKVIRNGVAAMKKKGYGALVCGHTHYADEQTVDGIQYFNTGTWTDKPLYYLHVNTEDIKLKEIEQ